MIDFVDAFLIAERDEKRRLATCLESIVWGWDGDDGCGNPESPCFVSRCLELKTCQYRIVVLRFPDVFVDRRNVTSRGFIL